MDLFLLWESGKYVSRWWTPSSNMLFFGEKNRSQIVYVVLRLGKKIVQINKTNERWWRKIMKDIILWDISIGNGYCRRHCCCYFIFFFFVSSYSFCVCLLSISRAVTCIHIFLEWKNVVIQSRGIKIVCMFACMCVFFFHIIQHFALCRHVKCAANTAALASFARDAELLMPLVLVKYCNVPLKRQFLWLFFFPCTVLSLNFKSYRFACHATQTLILRCG